MIVLQRTNIERKGGNSTKYEIDPQVVAPSFVPCVAKVSLDWDSCFFLAHNFRFLAVRYENVKPTFSEKGDMDMT